jgi:hypothetical protein
MPKPCIAAGVRFPWERVGLPVRAQETMWEKDQDLCPKSGRRMAKSPPCLSTSLFLELTVPSDPPPSADPKAPDVYDFFLQWIGEWSTCLLAPPFPFLSWVTRILPCPALHSQLSHQLDSLAPCVCHKLSSL